MVWVPMSIRALTPTSILLTESEEVAGFFAAMVKTDYAQKSQFVKNFFDDWRTSFMSKEEKALITDFKKW